MGGLILVRYGELALKSPPVRREFEATLRRQLLDQFLTAGASCRVRSDRGHLYLEVDELARAVRLACRVFGVTSVSPATEVATERDAIRLGVLEMAAPAVGPGRSFAIRARRTGQHAFTSQEIAGELGGAVLDRWPELGLRVDLTHPDIELFVEVRGPRTYLYRERSAGPGGLPLGVAGRVVAVVEGRRGALGAYLMMKRGCRCDLVISGEEGRGPSLVLARLDPAAVRREVTDGPGATESAVEALAEARHADGIVLSLDVDAFPAARARWGDRPVFSPTVGLDDAEVDARWQGVEAIAG